MFQVCVPATGKQEVSMPLGVLKSEFNWKKSFFGKSTLFLYNVPYCQCMLQIWKKAMLSISTQLYNLSY